MQVRIQSSNSKISHSKEFIPYHVRLAPIYEFLHSPRNFKAIALIQAKNAQVDAGGLSRGAPRLCARLFI